MSLDPLIPTTRYNNNSNNSNHMAEVLGVISSVFTLVEAIKAASNILQKLLSIRKAPAKLYSLSNEVSLPVT